jgi:hypothetical protein
LVPGRFLLAHWLAVGQNRAHARLGVVCLVALEWGTRSRALSRVGLAADSSTGSDLYSDDLLPIAIVLSVKQVVKLVFAVLMRVSERWEKKSFSEFEQQQIRSLRRRLKLDDHEVRLPDPKPEAQSRRSAASAA